VEAYRGWLGVCRHEVVMCPAGQDLADDRGQRGEHVVPRCGQQDAVEPHVVLQVGLEIALAAGHRHPDDCRGELPALLGGRMGGSQGGCDRFDPVLQLTERAQLACAVRSREPPPDEPWVERVPVGAWADRDADASSGRDDLQRLEHLDDVASHRPRDAVLLRDLVDRDHRALGELPRDQGGAQPGQHALVQPARGLTGSHAPILPEVDARFDRRSYI
jgi:hypothetical protein